MFHVELYVKCVFIFNHILLFMNGCKCMVIIIDMYCRNNVHVTITCISIPFCSLQGKDQSVHFSN